MVLAVSDMSAGLQAIFFAVAIVCFLLAAFRARSTFADLGWLGLAFFAFVWFWSALAAA